ncbi:MAG: tRNA (adenosine(37)-N6)-dimethylallyltransferase MiaA [Candidatus Pacebacteria bacterium]|nr:tRNA (adenosine(37)-N6)-dimethylallyltransferase MiaA [Candidatus Paceibacterota bacterium]
MDKKLIVILGPTASGKSKLAIKLAKKFNGEIISADSRQVYKGMDIGTGKVTKKEMKGIPHYLLDVVSLKKRFTVTQYRKLTFEAISKIFKKGKVPFLCGGTGFYIQAVVDGILIPEVPPDWKLRKKLEKKSVEKLYKILKKLDPRRAREIEKENPRRLIRAIEIILKTKKPVPPLKKSPLPYPVLIVGIKKPKEELKKLIKKRFFKWLRQGFLKEILKLRKFGISWQKIEEFGIHYRVAAQYLQNKITDKEMVENSLKELQNYAKRQMTWFKKDKCIHWLRNYKEAEKLVKKFLK